MPDFDRTRPPSASDRGCDLEEVVNKTDTSRPQSDRRGSSSHRRPPAPRHQSSSSQSGSQGSSRNRPRNNNEDQPSIIIPDAPEPRLSSSSDNPSSRSRTRSRLFSLFTNKPLTEDLNTSRVRTEYAPLGNERTHLHGMAVPSALQSEFEPTVVPLATNSSIPTALGGTEIAGTTRIKTEHAPLGNERTHADGMALPSHLQSNFDPTVVPGAPGTVSTSNKSRSSNHRPSLNNRTGSNVEPSPNRTLGTQVQGLVPASKYEREHGGQSYPAHSSLVSSPPAHVLSIFENAQDREMASRQTQIASMRPEQRKEQNNWAQKVIRKARIETSACPSDYKWQRIEAPPGYQCEKGGHLVSDELIAEGKGGIFVVPGGKRDRRKTDVLWGPYYQASGRGKAMVYGGDPNVPAPEEIDEKGNFIFKQMWRLCPSLNGPPTTQREVDMINGEIEKLRGPRRRDLILADFEPGGIAYEGKFSYIGSRKHDPFYRGTL